VGKEIVLKVEQVSKKFCRSLQRSMWYGLQDIFKDLIGFRGFSTRIRTQEFWAVDDLSFELGAGECLGLIGHNGAGKSTLLKILNGIVRPDRGTVTVRGRLGALIELGAGFHPQLTGRENISINAAILGMSKKEIAVNFEQIVEFADIGDFLDSPVKFYSSGMFVRLGMAIALHTNPQILLIDEVFAVGDIKFQARCFNRIGELRRNGVAFILVSHNLHHIAGYSDRVLVLDHGRKCTLDTPKPAVETYLGLMKIQSVTDDSLEHERANGTGRIKFTNIRLCDNGGSIIDRVSAMNPLSIRIDYDAGSDFSNLELDIVMYEEGNRVFFQGSNLLYGQPIDVIKGRGTIHINFSQIAKNNGKLHLTLALWSKGRHELFDWRRGIEFDVGGCSLSQGSVWLPCSFEIHACQRIVNVGNS